MFYMLKYNLLGCNLNNTEVAKLEDSGRKIDLQTWFVLPNNYKNVHNDTTSLPQYYREKNRIPQKNASRFNTSATPNQWSRCKLS